MMKTPPFNVEKRAHRRIFAVVLLVLAPILLLPLTGTICTLTFRIANNRTTPPMPLDFLPITGLPIVILMAGPMLIMLLVICALIIYLSETVKREESETGIAPATNFEGLPRKRRAVWGWFIALGSLTMALSLGTEGLLLISPSIYNTAGKTYLAGVAQGSPGEAWAVGYVEISTGGYYGVIRHFSGGQWTEVTEPSKNTLSAVATLPDGEAWAVGEGGEIAHETGGNWQQVDSGTTDNLNGLSMVTPYEGWAVGGSIPIASSGQDMKSSLMLAPLIAHNRAAPAQPVAAHDTFCSILHYADEQWVSMSCPIPAYHQLNSVVGLLNGEAWAVGNYGIILHEHYGVWKKMVSPVHTNLLSIAMISSNEGWAVGTGGTLLHYIHSVWTQLPMPGSMELEAIQMLSPGEGWIVGNTILHYSAGSWKQVAAPLKSEELLYSLTASTRGNPQGWSVGSNGTILQEQQNQWSAY